MTRLLVGSLVLMTTMLFVVPVHAQPERRVALIIGNSTYREGPLKNPVNDARAMAPILRQQGFKVILKENATKSQMEEAIANFGDELSQDTVALFYYAGHGIQLDGRNYLVPTDARLHSEQRVRLETIDVDVVLEQVQAAKARLSVVILDACRNNPFERRFRGFGRGLAHISAPEGTIIAYATAPGKVASDGEGKNGLYTSELLTALQRPGLRVEDVFKQVRARVSRLSNGTQIPWEASSLIGDFYFNSAPNASTPADRRNTEAVFWDSIRNSIDPAEYQAYLATYPKGTFVALAKARILALGATQKGPKSDSPISPILGKDTPQIQYAAPTQAEQLAALPPSERVNGQWAGEFGCYPHGGQPEFRHWISAVIVANRELSFSIGDQGQPGYIWAKGLIDNAGGIDLTGAQTLATSLSMPINIRGKFDGAKLQASGNWGGVRLCWLTLTRTGP